MAMAVAAVYAAENVNADNVNATSKTNAGLNFPNQTDLDRLMLFCPADHHIPGTYAFIECIQNAIKAADSGFIVTFGVMPTHPSSAYSYILAGAPLDAYASKARLY